MEEKENPFLSHNKNTNILSFYQQQYLNTPACWWRHSALVHQHFNIALKTPFIDMRAQTYIHLDINLILCVYRLG